MVTFQAVKFSYGKRPLFEGLDLVVRPGSTVGLLGLNGHHQWWTVQGGSVEYVRRLENRLARDGVRIETGAPVQAVARDDDAATLHFADRPSQRFDQVVLACHSDDALRLLARPTPAEARALGAVRFRPNRVVLHTYTRLLPQQAASWRQRVASPLQPISTPA